MLSYTGADETPPKRWFFVRWLLLFLVVAVLVPTVYLLDLPYVPSMLTTNPTKTTLMELREKQARKAGQPFKLSYQWKDLDEISPYLIHAALLSEDDMFYQHKGFDMEQIQIALKRDWDKRQYVYGGSTITQQLARSLYLTPSKNLLRKGKEALITVLLERYLSKDRIMELYLNVVEWGPGVFGAEAASRYYFKKPAVDLTPDEAVALVSILPSPRKWNPMSERSFMARRRTRLYERMRREGYVPPAANPLDSVPDEIRQMAIEANSFFQKQEQENQTPNYEMEPDTTTDPDAAESNAPPIDPALSVPGPTPAPQ